MISWSSMAFPPVIGGDAHLEYPPKGGSFETLVAAVRRAPQLQTSAAPPLGEKPRRPLTPRCHTQYTTWYDIGRRCSVSVRHALLALLSEGPKYGLQLRQEFEARTGEVWPLNIGQVYTTLQRLERDGLVESNDAAEEGPQRGSGITKDGEEELSQWLRTPPDHSSPPRDELVNKELIDLREPGMDVQEVMQAHRR